MQHADKSGDFHAEGIDFQHLFKGRLVCHMASLYRQNLTAIGGKKEMKVAALTYTLELNKLTNLGIECASNLYEHIDADVGRSRLDLPEVGPADTRHECKLPLRDALRSAQLADSSTQTPLFAYVLHALSMRAIRFCSALYGEHS